MTDEKPIPKSKEFEAYKQEFETFIEHLYEWADDEKDQRFTLQDDGTTWMESHGFGSGFNPLSMKQRKSLIWEWMESNDPRISKYSFTKDIVACFVTKNDSYMNRCYFYRTGKKGIYLYEKEGSELELVKRGRFKEKVEGLLEHGLKFKYGMCEWDENAKKDLEEAVGNHKDWKLGR